MATKPTFMPYCQTNFRAVPPERVEEVLSSLTKESFVGGQSAYQLDDGTFSIDAGENDIRAIYDQENAEIKFFCRYQRDMHFYDKKLMAFATKHDIDTKPCTASSEY